MRLNTFQAFVDLFLLHDLNILPDWATPSSSGEGQQASDPLQV